MSGNSPSSSPEIGSIVDTIANQSLIAASAAFEHRAMAHELRLRVEEYVPSSVTTMPFFGPLAFVFGAACNGLRNARLGMKASGHERAAEIIMPTHTPDQTVL